MRRSVGLALALLMPTVALAAHDALRLDGIAYTEGAAKEVQIQVWAVGEQLEAHPEWQLEPVSEAGLRSGAPFSVRLGEARLPVRAELSAPGHVAVALQVVLPEQLELPAAWLRRGEPLPLRVRRGAGAEGRLLVWGEIAAGAWSWDARRWRPAVAHIEPGPDGALEVAMPPRPWTLALAAAGADGSFASLRVRETAPRAPIELWAETVPVAVRVLDQRHRPAAGVGLREASSPLAVPVRSDTEGRARLQVPARGEWRILALGGEGVASRTGRGRATDELDLVLGPPRELELRWPRALGALVLQPGSATGSFAAAPLAASGGVAVLPGRPELDAVEYWGPGVAAGWLVLGGGAGALPLPAQAPMRIDGRVEAQAGFPVAGLPVWVRMSRSAMAVGQRYGPRGRETPLEPPWLPWAVTDSAGRFVLSGLPPEDCELELRPPGLPFARSARQRGAPGAAYTTLVRLERGASLALRVTDPAEAPLADALVEVLRIDPARAREVDRPPRGFVDEGAEPEASARSDDEGRVVFAAVPVGTLRLDLRRPGSVARSLDPVEVPADGRDLGDVVLEPGVTLLGTTVGPDGLAVAGAEVFSERDPEMPAIEPAAVSDGEGRFAIPDLDPAGELYLRARAEGLVPAAPLKVELPPEGEVEVAMAAARSLTGRVLDARDDAPLPGVRLHLSLLRRPAPALRGSRPHFIMRVGEARSDAEGVFLFDGIESGEFDLHAKTEGYRLGKRRLQIADDGEPEPVVLRLDPGLPLAGRVETEDGEPAGGLEVQAAPTAESDEGVATRESATSDVDGRFRFSGLGADPVVVTAWSRDRGRMVRARAEPGQPDELVLRFERAETLRGVVLDPEGGPVAGAAVLASRRDGGEPLHAEGDRDGRFEMAGAVPGSWWVGATAEGFVRGSSEVEVRAGEGAVVELRLQRGATVVGTVLGLRASELESCALRVSGAAAARPAADGSFRITGVPTGRQVVTATEQVGGRSRSVGIAVPESGEAAPVEIDFSGGLAVGGRVLRGGAGVAGLTVTADGIGSASRGRTVSGGDGGWRVGGLEPGEYQLAVQSTSGEVVAGDHVLLEADAEIDLLLPEGVLTGRVLEAETRVPVANAEVTAVMAGVPPVQRMVASDAAGDFELTDLADSAYLVQASAAGRRSPRHRVQLRDGIAEPLELLLEREGGTVLVVREAGGSPPTRISVTSLGGGVLGPSLGSVCDGDGRCELPGLPPGRWTLLVRGAGGALAVVDVPGGEVSVRLRPVGRLAVSAPEADGGAVWQLRLSEAASGLVLPVYWFFNPGNGEWVPVPASGLALSLPEGAWRLEIAAPDGTLSAREAVVRAGGETEIALGPP